MEVLTRKIKEFFRYPISSIYMLFAMVLTFVALFKGMDMYNQLLGNVEDKERYAYRYMNQLSVSCADGVDLISLSEGVTANVYVDYFCVGLDKEEAGYICRVYMNVEDIKFDFIKGGMPSDEGIEKGIPTVVIGRFHEAYCEEIDGKDYISINGSLYLVSGVIGSENSDYLDDFVFTEYEYLHENERELLSLATSDVIVMESDKSVLGTYNEMLSNSEESGIDMTLTASGADFSAYEDDDMEKLYGFLYLFCLVNCVIASEFFVWERYREIVIRKTYGFNICGIFLTLFGDVLKLAGAASVVGIIITLATGGLSAYSMSLRYIGMTVLMVLVSSLIIVILPLIKATNIMPGTKLK